MHKRKEKLLDKIVIKNYNNELEEVLEKKNFDENTKSLLLNILYKIETSYKDYEKVKRDVETKDEFIENIIKIIKYDCNDIKVIKLQSEENKMLGTKTFLVEKKSKRIICYPIERKLFYCISKISKKDRIINEKYFLIDKTLSELINVGNNINTVEVMRDFNGYSWTTLPREIESISHNLIYQNLRILVGNDFLNNWIKNNEYIIDYMELLKNKLEDKYGKENSNEILKLLNKLSILLAIKFNPKIKQVIENDKKEIEKNINLISSNQKFVEEITKEKINLTKEIKTLDETINNKNMLKAEYEKRNEKLPLNEKIFSVRILSKIMADEREKKINKIEELNKLLKPKKFVEYKKGLEQKEEYLKLIEIKDIENEIEKTCGKFQKLFLKCFQIRIQNVVTKQDIINLIYLFRYYNLLPFNQKIDIGKMEDIAEEIEQIKRNLIDKAHEIKVIDKFSKDEEIDYELLKIIFDIRVISLEDLYIKLIKEKEKYYIQLFDENVFEEKIEMQNMGNLNKKDLEVKLNKKTKIFS